MNRYLGTTGLVLVLAAGCGGDDAAPATTVTATTDPATTTTSSTAAVPVATVVAATTTVAAETPASSAPTTPAPTTLASTTTPAAEPPADSACLEGDWVMSDADTTALYGALLPGMPVAVTGSQALSFDGERAEQYVNVVIEFTVPGTQVSIPFDTHSAGPYSVDDDVLLLEYDLVEGGFDPADGEFVDDNGNDAGVMVINGIPVPAVELPTLAGGPMTCDTDRLTIAYTSGLADAVGVYTRA